jgi:signal transduction histidine kinase
MRANAIGAELSIKGGEGSGTKIMVVLPLRDEGR